MVVAFTGYRPEKMPFVESKKDEAYLKFRKRQLQVIERLIERGCTHFISGVAMGFDTWVAEDIMVLLLILLNTFMFFSPLFFILLLRRAFWVESSFPARYMTSDRRRDNSIRTLNRLSLPLPVPA